VTIDFEVTVTQAKHAQDCKLCSDTTLQMFVFLRN